jgi:hypothetical protein
MNNQTDRDMLIEVSTLVREMHTRLFGNGQPGEIDKINKDVKSLVMYRSRLIGALSVVTFVLLAFGGVLLANILNSH